MGAKPGIVKTEALSGRVMSEVRWIWPTAAACGYSLRARMTHSSRATHDEVGSGFGVGHVDERMEATDRQRSSAQVDHLA